MAGDVDVERDAHRHDHARMTTSHDHDRRPCLNMISCAPPSPPPASRRSWRARSASSLCCAARLSPATRFACRLHRRDRRGAVRPLAARRPRRLHRSGRRRHGTVRRKARAARRGDRHDAVARARPRPAVPAFLHLGGDAGGGAAVRQRARRRRRRRCSLWSCSPSQPRRAGADRAAADLRLAAAGLAEARGVPLRFVSAAFLAIVAVAVAECAQIVGVLLVFTLMVGPAAAALNFTRRLPPPSRSRPRWRCRGLGRPDARLLYRLAGASGSPRCRAWCSSARRRRGDGRASPGQRTRFLWGPVSHAHGDGTGPELTDGARL